MHSHHINPLLEELMEITEQNPADCYQCGKCSAGCPVREFATDPPNRIVRYVQLGYINKALESDTIWLCAGCLTCSSRCPQNFNLAKFMDALREIAIKNGVKPTNKKFYKFHQAFLNQIRNNGRAYELGLVIDYKLSTGDLFQDIDVAPTMLLKGKLGILPHKIKGKDAIEKIFKNAGEEKE